jgi:hypothetical protein
MYSLLSFLTNICFAIIFSITRNTWCKQLSPYTLHKRRDNDIVFKHMFQFKQADNNKSRGFQTQSRYFCDTEVRDCYVTKLGHFF